MQLYIQDPANQNAPFLHEKILEICDGATRGAGAFAFVTRDGVDLLLRDKVFQKLARRGTFDLIVGVDDVTDEQSLTALREVAGALPGLAVNVFYHDHAQPVFHPKLCWFRRGNEGLLVTGSGNLTAGGLRGNWEAFAVGELDANAADALEEQWTRWVELHSSDLRGLDDNQVIAQARLNHRRRRFRGRPPAPPKGEEPEILREVLISEIPKGSDRWKQANFHKDIFEGFFGVRPGLVRRIALQRVGADGSIEGYESRQSVAVKSRNFRFELEAGAGLAYPAQGRPIAVFVRMAPRTFRYRLVMPGDPGHSTMDGFLQTRQPLRIAGQMREIRTDTDELRRAWPDSPLLRLPLEIGE